MCEWVHMWVSAYVIVNEWMNEWMGDWVIEWVSEWVGLSEWVIEWVWKLFWKHIAYVVYLLTSLLRVWQVCRIVSLWALLAPWHSALANCLSADPKSSSLGNANKLTNTPCDDMVKCLLLLFLTGLVCSFPSFQLQVMYTVAVVYKLCMMLW
jgi:hypothetical protein